MKSGGQHDGRIFGDKLIRGLYDNRPSDSMTRGFYDNKAAHETMHRTAVAGSAVVDMLDSVVPAQHAKIKYDYLPSAVTLFVTNAAILTTRGQVGKDVLRQHDRVNDQFRDRGTMPIAAVAAAGVAAVKVVRVAATAGQEYVKHERVDPSPLAIPLFAGAAAAALKAMYEVTCRAITTGAAAAFSLVPASALNPYGIQEGQEI